MGAICGHSFGDGQIVVVQCSLDGLALAFGEERHPQKMGFPNACWLSKHSKVHGATVLTIYS